MQKSKSQKKDSNFWKAYVQCKRPECSVKVSLSITSANKETLELRTSGNLYHDIRRTYADDIKDYDREDIKCHIEEHFHTPPAKMYGVILTLMYMHQGIEKQLEDPQR